MAAGLERKGEHREERLSFSPFYYKIIINWFLYLKNVNEYQ